MSNRINVDRSVGITRVHKVAVQAISNKQYSKKIEDLTSEELEKAEEAAEEGYLAYIMIMNSSTEHNKLKTSLADDYAKGQDTYPKNRQDALRLLDTFTRNAPPRAIESEGGGGALLLQRSLARKNKMKHTGRIKSATTVVKQATQQEIALTRKPNPRRTRTPRRAKQNQKMTHQMRTPWKARKAPGATNLSPADPGAATRARPMPRQKPKSLPQQSTSWPNWQRNTT
jgi:hypothetical protein